MAARDHLNPQQFFHGTHHEFAPGEEVAPRSGNAYATTYAANAKMYGPHVYQVEFTGKHEADPEYTLHRKTNEGFRMSQQPLRVVRDATDYATERVAAKAFG